MIFEASCIIASALLINNGNVNYKQNPITLSLIIHARKLIEYRIKIFIKRGRTTAFLFAFFFALDATDNISLFKISFEKK